MKSDYSKNILIYGLLISCFVSIGANIYFLTLKNSYKLRYELEEKIPDNDNVSHAGNTKLSHEYQEQIQFKDSINDQIFNKPQISR